VIVSTCSLLLRGISAANQARKTLIGLFRFAQPPLTDLFAEDETSYFDDPEQFFALQKEAVEELKKHHEARTAWVDITGDYRAPEWKYRKARKNQRSGVLINLSPSGAVEVREGLVRPKIEKDTAEAIAENPIAPLKVKAAYSAPLCRYIAHHKTVAVAEVFLASPRTAQEVLVTGLMRHLEQHEAFRTLAKEAEPQSAYRALEAQALHFAGKLGIVIDEGESVWDALPPTNLNSVGVYEAVRGLSDHDLTGLQHLLTALSFGQGPLDKLDTSDSLFNRVARDLNVDMKNHWRPDAAFFGKRNREQLVGIAKECGYADGNGSLGSYKKSELTSSLVRHFVNAHSTAEPTEPQRKALAWLPEAMLFPAVDPGAAAEVEVDEGEDDGE
jgi:ParB family transcriptional regulator, chromosome partitioning protein